MTSAGGFTSANTCAMVNVLPEPVTPSRTWLLSPRRRASVSCAMARGWSPRNSKSDSRLKRSPTAGSGTDIANLRCYRTPSAPCRDGRQVAGAGADLCGLVFRGRQLDLDLAELAVGLRVRGHVADRVAGADFIEDPRVNFVQFL